MRQRAILLGVMAWVIGSAAVAQQAVLYTGSDWCESEAPFTAVWRAPWFAEVAGVALMEVDEPEAVTEAVRAQWEAQKAWRLELDNFPAVAYFDAAGRCVYLREGLSAADPREARAQLLSALAAGRAAEETLRTAMESQSPEEVGQALATLSAGVGRKRLQAPNVLKALWEKLKAVDPQDASGWRFALTFDPAGEPAERVRKLREGAQAEGFEASVRMASAPSNFHERGDVAGFEAYYRELSAHPAQHLTLNQRQGLLLLRYAFYGKDPARSAQMLALLREVAAMGGETHFGAAALGLLCLAGEGPVAVPYGWRPGHAQAGAQWWPVTLGTRKVIRAAGWYELTLRRKQGRGAMRVEALRVGEALKAQGAGEVAAGQTLALRFWVAPEEVGQRLALRVHFEDPSEESGELALREVLPPRAPLAAAPAGEPWAERAGEAPVRAYARRCFSPEALREVMGLPGGAAFLTALFGEEAWLEALFANGRPLTSWDATLRALDLLAYTFDLRTERDRRWAIAAALNAGSDPIPMALFFRNLAAVRARGHLWRGAEGLSVAQLRYLFLPEQLPPESLLWLAERHNLPPRRYNGACWTPPYRLFNFFGESIHGPNYYPPWRHRYLRHEEAREVGGVCGALSYYGSAAAKAAGVPSTPAGQPGHCAYTLWEPSERRWVLAYNVGPYTETHFDPWDGKGPFSQEELAAEAFAHPGRLAAMRRFWQTELRKQGPYAAEVDEGYAEAFAACPLSLTIARAWSAYLAACPEVPTAAWERYLERVSQGLRGHPECLWRTVEVQALPALAARAAQTPLLQRLVALQGALRQREQKSDEFCNFAALLDRQAKLLGDEAAPCLELFSAALDAQFGTPDAFGQLLRWGSARFLKEPALATDFVARLRTAIARAGRTEPNLPKFLGSAIQAASAADNAEAFNALCDLQESLAATPRAAYDFPGLPADHAPLLSARALLRLSTTSGWDRPEAYRCLLDGAEPGEICHTAEESAPWAEVKLPGMAEISAVYLLNRDHLQARLVPFTLEASEDGEHWMPLGSATEVQERYCFTFAPVKARMVRVTCHPLGEGKTFLHLRKFALFGKKLY